LTVAEIAFSVPGEYQMLSEKWYGATRMGGDASIHTRDSDDLGKQHSSAVLQA